MITRQTFSCFFTRIGLKIFFPSAYWKRAMIQYKFKNIHFYHNNGIVFGTFKLPYLRELLFISTKTFEVWKRRRIRDFHGNSSKQYLRMLKNFIFAILYCRLAISCVIQISIFMPSLTGIGYIKKPTGWIWRRLCCQTVKYWWSKVRAESFRMRRLSYWVDFKSHIDGNLCFLSHCWIHD